MMRLSKEEIGSRSEAVAKAIRSSRLLVEVLDGESIIGGGSAPSASLPTRLLAIACEGKSADELSSSLRASNPPIVARVEDGRVLLDFRTVFPEQDEAVTWALQGISKNGN
jgi:L-seryl-tRNA(Ser) seleniumtransferase